jgi:pimeloyl-ACP methyl ester carboxylesterase
MKLKLSEVEIDYAEEGSGPPVLLIHGFPFDRRIWESQIPALAARYRVSAPDLRGFGQSEAPAGPYSMDLFARDLFELMDRRGIERFAAAGHSMGGYILFAMHRLSPKRLTRLALLTTRATADDETGKKNREATAARVLAEGPAFLAEVMAERVLGRNPAPGVAQLFREIILSQDPVGVAAASRAMAERPDSRPQLASIQVPTLVIAGLEDKLVPLEETRAMAAAIPGAQLLEIEGSSHLPMMERPEQTAAALLAFLDT